ncbi:hypothetical protein CIB48_g7698 [Xylaria polymorpha]|nr:hypothetical protein CIB48_g7698 [Xylaria polymorpha]
MFFTKTVILLEWIRIFVADRQRNAFIYAPCVLIGLNLGVHTVDSFAALVNLVVDLGILLLPQRAIWRLQMSIQRKIGLSILFSIGIVACASAAGRAYYVAALNFAGDVSYGAPPAFLFRHGEMTTVPMVFCILCPKGTRGQTPIPSTYVNTTNNGIYLTVTIRAGKAAGLKDG